jgi:hypothetical protein
MKEEEEEEEKGRYMERKDLLHKITTNKKKMFKKCCQSTARAIHAGASKHRQPLVAGGQQGIGGRASFSTAAAAGRALPLPTMLR